MKRNIVLFGLAALAVPASLLAEVNVNVSVGVPAPQVVVAGPPGFLFEAPPLFLAPPRLGFYVGVDVPYDLLFASNYYYIYYGNAWYRSSFYNGPWFLVQREHLPPVIRKYRLETIRSYRDREYRVYHRDRDQYRATHRSRHFQPEWREERRDDRRRGGEEIRVREERRDDFRRGSENAREERRHERGDRRDDQGRGRGHEHRRGD